jgi:hypothetical protein
VKPLVDLPDAERVVIDILEDAGHPVVKTDYPSTRLTGTDYWLQVDLEASNTADYPVTERAQVRVTAHVAPGRRTAVKLIAAEALADLYTSVSSTVAGIVPISGRSAVSTDPATGNVMCWVLVRVDLLASLATP